MERIRSGKRGGRLVEDDDSGVSRQSPHDAEDGFARGAQRTHGSARVRRIERHGAIDVFGLTPDLLPRDEAAGPRKSRHQSRALADGQFVNQAKILMDKRDRHDFRLGMNPTPAHQKLA